MGITYSYVPYSATNMGFEVAALQAHAQAHVPMGLELQAHAPVLFSRPRYVMHKAQKAKKSPNSYSNSIESASHGVSCKAGGDDGSRSYNYSCQWRGSSFSTMSFWQTESRSGSGWRKNLMTCVSASISSLMMDRRIWSVGGNKLLWDPNHQLTWWEFELNPCCWTRSIVICFIYML